MLTLSYSTAVSFWLCWGIIPQVFGIAAGRGAVGNAAVRSVSLRPLGAGVLGEAGSQRVRGKQHNTHKAVYNVLQSQL